MKKDEFIETAYALIDTIAREGIVAAEMTFAVMTDVPGLTQSTKLQYACIEDEMED